MQEYVNHNQHTVHLAGPDGKTIKVTAGQRVLLPDYFHRYCDRGFIRLYSDHIAKSTVKHGFIHNKIQSRVKITQQTQSPTPPPSQIIKTPRAQQLVRSQQLLESKKFSIKPVHPLTKKISKQTNIVGKVAGIDPNELLQRNLANNDCYPISNNVGVGILSYNRGGSLKRLVDSIITNTDLRRTTIFISDDNSTDKPTLDYLDILQNNRNIIILRNNERLGVAGNSNRLLRCLVRFQYGMILNDDVEILKQGWDDFYVEAMKRTNLHHFLYRQEGIYGAKDGESCTINSVLLSKVTERPHGAVMAFDKVALDKIGYFNEAFGIYGMEHVDWSRKAWELGVQREGFYDVAGSAEYFKIHNEPSALTDRQELFNAAKIVWESRKVEYIPPTERSKVPSITYIVPFRNISREDSMATVVNNIRAQRYPVIDIILVEQDIKTNINLSKLAPCDYYLAKETKNLLFNKSKAFNLGLSKTITDKSILHDADIMAPGHYTTVVAGILDKYDSCHLGSTVIYTSEESMNSINRLGVIDTATLCNRTVGYYEGGSIACHTKTFWKVGGLNEDFFGYGMEDCDFYARLSHGSFWHENRTFDFLHLWHGRVPGWEDHHKINKNIGAHLQSFTIPDRIAMQQKQLRANGYAVFVDLHE